MNNFTDIHNLYPEQASSDNHIPLQTDEPDYSYLTRVMLLTPSMEMSRIVEKYFGNPHCRVEKPLHAGFGTFASHFGHNIFGSCNDAIDAHSMLAFFKPFADPGRYLNACELAGSVRGNGINLAVGLRGDWIFREQPATCLDCINDDQQNNQFANYRRSHQVLAASHCSIHHKRLITSCATCGTRFSHWDLPDKECHECGALLTQVEDNAETIPDHAARIRLSQVIASVFSEKIGAVDVNIRLDVLRNRTALVVKNRSGVIGDNLATHVNKMFGRTFLESLGLPTYSAPTLGWPALLIHGRSMVHDPVANCILIAALFDSVDEYIDSITSRQLAPEGLPTLPKTLWGAGSISFSMMREALRSPSLYSFVRPNGTVNEQFQKWMAGYPGLSNRRLNFLLHKKIRYYKKCILGKLEETPGLSRNQISTTLKTEVAYIRKYAPQWLEQHLPARGTPNRLIVTQAKELLEDGDHALSKQLAEVVNRIKASRSRPTRLKSLDLMRLSSLTRMPAEIHCNYPQTLKLVEQLSESMDKYYRRSLEWAYRDLARQYGKCDNISELFVHAKVGIEYIKPLESFAQFLLERENITV